MPKRRIGKHVGFKTLAKQVGSEALAAWIGRRKYGAAKFAQMAAAGRRKAGRRSRRRR